MLTDIPRCKTITFRSPTSPRRSSKESSAQMSLPTSISLERQYRYVSYTVGRTTPHTINKINTENLTVPPGGSIVFTSSGIVAQPNPLTIDYGASKAAITHLTRSLARQLAPAGIRVNAVAPGLTLTPFLATQGIRSENIPMLTANSPYGRILQPAEIAPLYVAVVDPLKTGVSGEIFTAAAAIPGP